MNLLLTERWTKSNDELDVPLMLTNKDTIMYENSAKLFKTFFYLRISVRRSSSVACARFVLAGKFWQLSVPEKTLNI